MAEILPPDFDAEAYAATYPDVALSGLSPRLHYLRFGRVMGRSASGSGSSPISDAQAKNPIYRRQQPGELEAITQPDQPNSEAVKTDDGIIDPPPGFDVRNSVPMEAPSRVSRGGGNYFTLDELASAAFMAGHPPQRFVGPLKTYARIFSLKLQTDLGSGAPICDDQFRSGPARIDNAWLAEPSLLRMMIAGGKADQEAASGWALRAYQADPECPAVLRQADGAIVFPLEGPVFVDFELAHELMPVILELADENGKIRGFALLPFPSLLPGGLHWGELKALQSDPHPMGSFWSLSEKFLAEHLIDHGTASQSLTSVSMKWEGSEGVENWLNLMFGLSVEQRNPDQASLENAPTVQRLEKVGDELRLILPDQAVPTISALTSGNFQLGDADEGSGPYIVAEAGSRRPRWSVAIPAGCALSGKMGLADGGSRERTLHASLIPAHLAIVFKEPPPFNPDVLASTLREAEKPSEPTTIVLDASHSEGVRVLIGVLKATFPRNACDLLVRLPAVNDKVSAELDELWGAGRWSLMQDNIDLPAIARASFNSRLLTLDARVLVTEEALARLFALMNDNPRAASVSCLLLQELTIKKQVVLEPGSGGLFPAGASLLAGPQLAFAEPDVSLALAGKTYPVVANGFDLTIWRKEVLAAVELTLGLPSNHAQLRLGLALTLGGYENLCTTTVQARVAGSPSPRDMVDPFGPAYVSPEYWATVFERVTTLRELF